MEVEGPGYLLICYTCINVDAEQMKLSACGDVGEDDWLDMFWRDVLLVH